MPFFVNPDGKLLVHEDGVLMDGCCCYPAYKVQSVIDWDNDADLNLYMMGDWVSAPAPWTAINCYFEAYTIYAPDYAYSMTLSHNAHPRCISVNNPPEVTTTSNVFQEATFYTWYNQRGTCRGETLATTALVAVINIGSVKIWANGIEIAGGEMETFPVFYNGWGSFDDDIGDGTPKGTILEVLFTPPPPPP